MPLAINPQTRITMLDPDFVSTINNLLKDTTLEATEVVALNFRDPSYNSETCSGFHPVEIHVDSKGDILSITDFAYFGCPLSWNSALSSIGASNRTASGSSILFTTSRVAADCWDCTRRISLPTTAVAALKSK